MNPDLDRTTMQACMQLNDLACPYGCGSKISTVGAMQSHFRRSAAAWEKGKPGPNGCVMPADAAQKIIDNRH